MARELKLQIIEADEGEEIQAIEHISVTSLLGMKPMTGAAYVSLHNGREIVMMYPIPERPKADGILHLQKYYEDMYKKPVHAHWYSEKEAKWKGEREPSIYQGFKVDGAVVTDQNGVVLTVKGRDIKLVGKDINERIASIDIANNRLVVIQKNYRHKTVFFNYHALRFMRKYQVVHLIIGSTSWFIDLAWLLENCELVNLEHTGFSLLMQIQQDDLAKWKVSK